MGGEAALLLVTDALAFPGAAIVWALEAFQDGKAMAVVTQLDALGAKAKQAADSVSVLISLGSKPGFHTTELLTELARIVKPGGELIVQEPCDASESSLQRNLLLAGFVSVKASDGIHISADKSVMIRAQKPTWETGSSFSIKRKTDTLQSVPNGSNGSVVVKLPALDMNIDDEDIIDEDSLLTEEDLKRPEVPAADDCEVGNAGRKACKNCTCGRAEAEESGKLSEDLLNNPQSACGNCGLGDAFRCGTCPYRGLPPFKLGEKISLSGTLLTADV